MSVQGEYKKGDTIYFNGSLVTVKDIPTEGTVTVVGASGIELSVPISFLKKTSLFEFHKKRTQECKERVERYQAKAEQAAEVKRTWKEKVKETFEKLCGLDKNDPMYAVVKDEMWDAKFKETAAGNLESSYLMSAFITASSTSNFCIA